MAKKAYWSEPGPVPNTPANWRKDSRFMVNISKMGAADKRQIWQLIKQDPELTAEISKLGELAKTLGGDVRLAYSEIVKLKDDG